MKVGILHTSHPDPVTEPHPHHAVHARTTREILEAEELGFDSIWIAEHHFSSKYGILPDPFSYLCYLAALTKRIKLCAGVMVVPLHHPMRIVENAAFVDILSNGRFQLGLGSGYRPYEFEGLGVDYETRRDIQEEAIPLILRGFHEKRLSANGAHYKFKIEDPYELYPLPVQQPHPPIYLGAGTDRSMTQAARWGFGLMQSTLPDLATIAQHIQTYRAHMKEAVAPFTGNPAFGEVDVARLVYVAPTDAQAREESAEAVVRHVRSFVSGGAGRYFGEVTAERDDAALGYDHLVKNTILHGSPDTVIQKIQALREVGATSVMLHYPPYYGAEKTSKMLRLFAKEVLPHVQAIPAPRLAA